MLQREPGGQFRRLQPFVPVVDMAESRQIIQQRLRQITSGSQLAQAQIALALGQWSAISPDDQRQMAIFRRGQFQRLQQQQLARGVRQMVFAAQHVGNPHQRIVYGVGEKELRRTIGPANDEIADVVAGKALQAAHPVGKFHRSPCGHPEAQGRLQAPLQSRAPFSLAQPGARAGIARWPASR